MNHSPRLRYGTLLLICLLLPSCAELGIYSPGRHGPGGSSRGNDPQVQVSVSIGISIGEARRLAVSHGITGMRALPPGIQRNLARGKALPPGIARRTVPRRLLDDLPHIPNHEWRIIGRDLILIAIGTLIVVDILENVFD